MEYVSEAAVGLGCIGEYIAEYTSWRTEGQRHTLGKRSLVVLTIGIGMGFLSLIQTNALSGVVIGSLGEQASQAANRANLATEAADIATKKAKSVVALAGSAAGAAGDAKTIAESARLQASVIKQSLVAIQEQADDIRDEIAWRHLSAKNVEAIRRSIPASSSRIKVEVRHLLSDPEAAKYAAEIAEALRPVLTIDGTSGMLQPWGTIPQGIGLYVKSLDVSGGAQVQRALKAGGIDAPGALLSAAQLPSTSGIVIFVWPKTATAQKRVAR